MSSDMSCNIITFFRIVIVANHTRKRFRSKFDILKRKNKQKMKFRLILIPDFKIAQNLTMPSNILPPMQLKLYNEIFCKQTAESYILIIKIRTLFWRFRNDFLQCACLRFLLQWLRMDNNCIEKAFRQYDFGYVWTYYKFCLLSKWYKWYTHKI